MSTQSPPPTGRGTARPDGAGPSVRPDGAVDATPEAHANAQRAQAAANPGGDASVAGGPNTSTPGGISRIGSGTTGLNNYSPGSDLGAG